MAQKDQIQAITTQQQQIVAHPPAAQQFARQKSQIYELNWTVVKSY